MKPLKHQRELLVRRTATAALLALVLAAGLTECGQETGTSTATVPTTPTTNGKTTSTTTTPSFATPKKSAHYESNTPAQANVFAGVPINGAAPLF